MKTTSLPVIRTEIINHREADQMTLRFEFNILVKDHLRKIEGVQWSKTHSCFYMLYTPENIRRLIDHARGTIWVDLTGLRKSTGVKNGGSSNSRPVSDPVRTSGRSLQARDEDLVRRMEEKILLKGYSPSTKKSYTQQLKAFLNGIPSELNPLDLTKEDIEQYLLNRQKEHPSSESHINMHINAIKFLYEQVLGKERMLFYLPRPEKPLQLPKVLGEHELERIFRSLSNLKHKTILLTAFSCGLRVGEVVRLRIRDIDSERMQVFIERSKGKKDRYVTLSPVLLDILRKYIAQQQPRPKEYLFEGQAVGHPYSARSAQMIFKRAAVAAGIRKKVSFHTLRHSYATHLLEKGVDIKYIKELLGHFDIKTTERYLHVAREKLVHIQSPLDYLNTDI